MNRNQILADLIHDLKPSDEWYHRAAVAAILKDSYWLIPTRDESGPYMLRMWLSPPRSNTPGSREKYSFSRSLCLHYFFRGDDDRALHDHPNAFRTRILCGGYQEHLPPTDWKPGSKLGPAWDKRIVERTAGDEVVHLAADLHCVGMVRPGTMTLVETGPKERKWGFHPEGQPWIDADTFLALAVA